jgi:hypothetical protein
MLRLLLLIGSIGLLFPLAAESAPLYANANGTGPCTPGAGYVCFWEWASTDTLADMDSGIYNVSKFDAVTYAFSGDGGTAIVQIYECQVADRSSSTCTVFTGDMNGDGLITAADRAIQLDGLVGTDAKYAVIVSKPFHYIDVIALPGSGSVSLTIKAHDL